MFAQSNYRKSNRLMTVKYKPSVKAQLYSKKIMKSAETDERQKICTRFLDLLCQETKLPMVKIKISDTHQYHAKRKGTIIFKQYGYYSQKRHYIYIQNKTPVRGNYLAPKTFLDTVLHEWLHHYDTYKLKLDSIHTSGFYARLKHLKELLGIL